jgi:hypothetical protein
MKNEELVKNLIKEAEELKIKENVLCTVEKLMELNPLMSKLDALKLALSNAKLHAGLNVRK